MDAKDRIAFQNAIMTEVRAIINAKFKGGGDEISTDSAIAIQQLIGMNSALREEFNKLAAGAKLTATCVEELQKRVGVLESTPVSARVPADIANLKASLVKIQEQLANDQSKARLAALETAIAGLPPAANGNAKRSAVSSAPSPSATPDPNASAPPAADAPIVPTGKPTEAKGDDPNAGGGPGGVEIKSSDINRRLTSLEGRIKAIPQPVPYDDSALVQRVTAVEENLVKLATRTEKTEQALAEIPTAQTQQPVVVIPPQATDLIPLQAAVAQLEAKVTALQGQAAIFQPFDPTPLISRIAKLEENPTSIPTIQSGLFGGANNNNTGVASALSGTSLSGLFGIGSQPSETALLKARVDNLEAQFAAMVQVGVAKTDLEPINQELAGLKARVLALQTPVAAQPSGN